MNIKTYKEAVINLNNQLDNLMNISESIGNQNDIMEKITQLKNKNQGEEFRILIMGDSDAGKHEAINAILGMPYLHENLASPATFALTEVKYGTTGKAVVHTTEGETFEKSLIEYLRENFNGISIEKVEISIPLKLLEDGVQIISIPAIENSEIRNDVINNYLPTAHAVIYCLDGMTAYENGTPKIDSTVARYVDTPIFLVTNMDKVVNATNTATLADFKETITFDLEQYTDLIKDEYKSELGGNGIFFVSAIQANNAKQSFDNNLLALSGFTAFDSYLKNYLEFNMDKDIETLFDSIVAIGKDYLIHLYMKYNNANQPLESLKKTKAEVDKHFKSANDQAYTLIADFKKDFYAIVESLRTKCKELPDTAAASIDDWRKGYVCTINTTDQSDKKALATAITTEFTDYINGHYKNLSVEWITNNLQPEINAKFKEIVENFEKKAKAIDEEISSITELLSITTQPESTENNLIDFINNLNTFKLSANDPTLKPAVLAAIVKVANTIWGAFSALVTLGPLVGGILVILFLLPSKSVDKDEVCDKVVKEYKNAFKKQRKSPEFLNGLIEAPDSKQLTDDITPIVFDGINKIQPGIQTLEAEINEREACVANIRENANKWASEISEIINASKTIMDNALVETVN